MFLFDGFNLLVLLHLLQQHLVSNVSAFSEILADIPGRMARCAIRPPSNYELFLRGAVPH